LRGKAASTAQKNLTVEYAKNVEGVNKVRNKMTVTPATEKTGEKIRKDVDITYESIDDAFVSHGPGHNHLVVTSFDQDPGVTVETKDVVAKLEGDAGSWDEKTWSPSV